MINHDSSSDLFCEECKTLLEPNWLVCPNCQRDTENRSYQICPRCFQVINFYNPKFCPFCKLSIDNIFTDLKGDVKPEKPIIVPDSKMPEIIQINPGDNSFTNDDIRGFLSFNFPSTIKIMEDRNFTNRSLQLLLISSVSSAALLVIISVLFDFYFDVSYMNNIFDMVFESRLGRAQPPTVTTLRRALLILLLIIAFQFSIYLGFAIFSTYILRIFNSSFNYSSQIRFTSGISISFLIRDGFLLLFSLYVFIFEGKDGGSIVLTAIGALTIVFTIYFIIQGMILTRKGIGGGFLQSLLIIIFVFFFTYIFTFYSMIFIIQLEAFLR